MKSLDRLTNVERAKLLFELHPDQIQGFITFARNVLDKQIIPENIQALKDDWNNGMITVDFWIDLINRVRTILIRYNTQLSKSKNLFSDQLFDGHLAFLTTTLLFNYDETLKPGKLKQTINLLFT